LNASRPKEKWFSLAHNAAGKMIIKIMIFLSKNAIKISLKI